MTKAIFIILTMAGFASGAEFEIPGRFSVDGYSEFRSSVAVINANAQTPFSLAVGTSAAYNLVVTTNGSVGIGTGTVGGARLAVIGTTDAAYSLAVGTSTNYNFVVSTGGNAQFTGEIYKGTYTVLDSSILDASGTMKAAGIQNTGTTAGISVSAATADRVLDYMEYSSTADAQAAYVSSGASPSGGTIATSGGKTIHTFRLADSGTNFVVPSGANGYVDVLVIAGGGGGGRGGGNSAFAGGGGGAGGVLYSAGYPVTDGVYAVTVGTGGAGTASDGGNGGNSVFGSLTAIGGGGAGSTGNGAGGGSGGGGGADRSGGSGTSGQGYAGGTGTSVNNTSGGGGGGAGGQGANSSGANGGNGGAGVSYSISGVSVEYAGGGGGASGYYQAAGATAGTAEGGGSPGVTSGSAANATPNTGGGGGGGSGYNYGSGGNGGSGVVIISYTTDSLNGTKQVQAYSEGTIRTQAIYSLKGVATTEALHKTLTRTVSPTVNLSGRTQINFDIRSSTTGSNIKIGLHDSGGTTTELTPIITSSDTWQTVNWDIYAVTDTNKGAIDRIVITITSAPVTNTFYIDNMYAPGGGNNDITFISGSERMRIDNSGNVGIGTTNPVADLDVGGSGSIKIPVGTTGQRPAHPAAGMMRFNTDKNRLELYTGAGWSLVTAMPELNCTGGTISTITVSATDCRVHTFTDAGTFTLNCVGSGNAEVLVVAGGGGGGRGGGNSAYAGGGGGAGGVLYSAIYPLATGAYTATVGTGGAGTASDGGNGGNSVFGSLTAIGGGGAGSTGNGAGGGSGGGGGADRSGGSGTSGQGYAGGTGTSVNNTSGGGGGGAGGQGANSSGANGGNGGAGVSYSISGVSVEYAGGGGGASGYYQAAGATAGTAEGGGSPGVTRGSAANATPNTGGGGGGGSGYNYGSGGNGGSGIVIVRYPLQ